MDLLKLLVHQNPLIKLIEKTKRMNEIHISLHMKNYLVQNFIVLNLSEQLVYENGYFCGLGP